MLLNSPFNESLTKAFIVGVDDRHSIELNRTDTFIGRSRDNDVVLVQDLSLSRRHAVITKVDGVYYLRDLRSSNGTLLNGVTVDGMVALNPNDEIFLGRTRFLFCPTAKKLHDTPPIGNNEPTTILPTPQAQPTPSLANLCNSFVSKLKYALAPESANMHELKVSIARIRTSHTEELLKGIRRSV
jgi:pSer/pThr/pTyr-binding forkhead associated (FHA) protein